MRSPSAERSRRSTQCVACRRHASPLPLPCGAHPCLCSRSTSRSLTLGPPRSRQIRTAHEEPVAFAGGAAALVDGPDDQALAAAHVAGGEHAGDVGVEAAVLRLGVAAHVLLHAELIEKLIFRTAEAQ